MSRVGQPWVINEICLSVSIIGSALDPIRNETLEGSRILAAGSEMCLVLCKLLKHPAVIKDFNIQWQFVRTATLHKDFLRTGWVIVSCSVSGIFSCQRKCGLSYNCHRYL